MLKCRLKNKIEFRKHDKIFVRIKNIRTLSILRVMIKEYYLHLTLAAKQKHEHDSSTFGKDGRYFS